MRLGRLSESGRERSKATENDNEPIGIRVSFNMSGGHLLVFLLSSLIVSIARRFVPLAPPKPFRSFQCLNVAIRCDFRYTEGALAENENQLTADHTFSRNRLRRSTKNKTPIVAVSVPEFAEEFECEDDVPSYEP